MTAASWRVVSSVSRYQVAAALLWAAGAYTSFLFLRAFNVEGLVAAVLAVAAQWFLTTMQAPMWHGHRNVTSMVFLLADTLINAGGLFSTVQRLDRTQVWQMLEAASLAGDSIGIMTSIGVSTMVGLLLAAAPEQVWHWR